MTPSKQLFLTIEDRIWPFAGMADASALYRSTIERLNLGSSETPACDIVIEENGGLRPVGYISYNGCVWELGDENPDGTYDVRGCVYDPYGNSPHREHIEPLLLS